jgi:hypothetical protein
MKSENIITALNDIDPELVEDAEGAQKRSSVTVFLKWGAAAAVLCLICGLALGRFLPMLQPAIPDYPDALYSASDIAGFFGNTYLEGTSSYTKIYVPSSEYLPLYNIPVSEYWTIYQYNNFVYQENILNSEEFQNFLDANLVRIADQLGADIPHYMVESHIDDISNFLSVDLHIGNCNLSASHSRLHHRITLSSSDTSSPEVCLGDMVIEIDQRQSDEEIIASLSAVKEKLFSMFDVAFSDATIHRSYDGYSNYGATSIEIFFYNEANCPLNLLTSDYVCLRFDNHQNFPSESVSNSILRNVTVYYDQLRVDAAALCTPSRSAASISLEEAEILLRKGYVFGGHSCPRCMAMQNKVNFQKYDFVDIVYIQSRNPNQASKDIIPFYAFYKKIGIAENGNEIYAKTYVPAIRVSGYEEYFKSQEAEHKN